MLMLNCSIQKQVEIIYVIHSLIENLTQERSNHSMLKLIPRTTLEIYEKSWDQHS